MKRLKVIGRRFPIFVLLAVLASWAAIPAAAQSTVPDLSQFGYPTVGGTAMFTPGQATSGSAGNQMVSIPADFLSVPAKFELLVGDNSSFHQDLSADDQSEQVIATFDQGGAQFRPPLADRVLEDRLQRAVLSQ